MNLSFLCYFCFSYQTLCEVTIAKNSTLTPSTLRKTQLSQSTSSLSQDRARLPEIGSEIGGGLAQLLRSFAASLRQSDVPGHAQKLLPAILLYAQDLSIARISIADACQVSEGTLSRWATNKSKPHIVVAQVAVQKIAGLALEKEVEYENRIKMKR